MTAKEISDRIIARCDDIAGSPGSLDVDSTGGPVPPEVLAAINEGQELFAFLTLGLEATATLPIPGSAAFFMIRSYFHDYLCPLRLTGPAGRVRPATLADLDAADDQWQATAPGNPTRYFTAGFNFMGVTPQPALSTDHQFTYARSPLQLVYDAFPEIPEEYHQSLVKYGVYRVKLKEGAQSLQRGMAYLNEFLDDAQRYGEFVRGRSKAARYDSLPFELSLFDRSRLVDQLIKKGPKPWQQPAA